MSTVDKVKRICKNRKIPISRLEKDLGFSNGYINQLRKGTFPSDRLALISKYLDVPISELLGDNVNATNDTLTASDRKDIAKSLDEMMEQLESGTDSPLMYNGQELSETSKALLRNALEYALTETKKENKVKYNPNKNKG
ncbi:helix-turn-helix domain-containing protein [Lachnoanaerobaculum umeaense]|uniref:XRE family transcriptional regulator n=1 Tax=Lachnoanaerobaculum umeaense TaxID=617123 RepID=A0A385Q3A4_9FIRM|nr:helix-turn-helix transcriptional regulator [Lachnoanaerobaculum umeaense]AYB00098.1 XRE family transcriptional regulator [Lachnoanaerobaculum umeaense]PZW97397.1 Cro/C1-type helix-turn-helix DNA-binding protein [Lachnoanaerobaculum umeaense]